MRSKPVNIGFVIKKAVYSVGWRSQVWGGLGSPGPIAGYEPYAPAFSQHWSPH